MGMKGLKSGYVAALLALAFFAVSCTSTKAPELKSVEIAELSRTAGEGLLRINLRYANPNGGVMTLSGVDLAAMINQKDLDISGPGETGQEFPGKAETVLETTFTFDPDEIYPGFLSKQFGAIGSRRVRITLSGTLTFARGEKTVEVPVDYSEVYKLPN